MVKLIDRFINLCRYLILDKNKLSGVIPECMHRFSKLEYVHFLKYVLLSYSTCQETDTNSVTPVLCHCVCIMIFASVPITWRHST